MKGNVLVGQAGGPTAVINASLVGVIQASQVNQLGEQIYGMEFGIEGLLEGRTLDLTSLSQERVDRLAYTPGSALGSCRYKLTDEDLPHVHRMLEKHNIRYLFYIGGNDTMDSTHRIEAYCRSVGYEIITLGVPKTVDNDLHATDHTPGYPSSARYVAMSIQQGGRLAADMQRVDRFTVYQTVGRDAGWLAAASALAKERPEDPPHLIYVPERPLEREQVLTDVERTIENFGWASIVVGEGAVWTDGTPVSASQVRDRFSNIEFGATGGTAAALALHRLIHDEFGHRGEFQIPESLHMCADDRVSAQDRLEAQQVGIEAVRLATEGISGRMVTIRRKPGDAYEPEYGTAHLEDVAAKAKPMPQEFLTDNYVTTDFLDYLRPLTGSLPTYERLR